MSPRLVSAALAVAIATCAGSAAAVKIAFDTPGPPPSTNGRTVHTTSSTVLDVAKLPHGAIPEPLDAAHPPTEAKTTSVDFPDIDVVVVEPTRSSYAAVRKKKKPYVSLSLRLRGVGGFVGGSGNAAGVWLQQACGQSYANYPAHPVRWEHLRIEKTGVSLDVVDAWFFPASCGLDVVTRTTVPLAVIARADDVPIAFAFANDGGLNVLFPPVASIAADTGVADPNVIGGAMTRVTLPLHRGFAGSVAASFPYGTFESWKTTLTGKPSAAQSQEIAVALDVVQSLSDPAPTVLLRTGTGAL